MTKTLRIEALAIGDELLDGRLADTNSQLLAERLSGVGLALARASAVDDDIDAIVDALRDAAGRADVIVTSGGLGPTTDDLTAQAVAQAAGCALRLDEEAWRRIQERFASRALPMPPNNRRQAEVPDLATTWPNEVGAAPGFQTPLGGAQIFSFPGVPREYAWLVQHALLPWLASRLPPEGRRLRASRTLRCLGITESALGHALRAFEALHPDVRVQYRTSFPENHVRIVVEGDDDDALAHRADALAHEAREAIGESVYGIGEQTLEQRVADAIRTRGDTLALAESCTGGLLGARMTAVPGVSALFRGGVVAYDNDIKTALLGVSRATLRAHGAVSEEVAAEMALGARQRLGATWALSTTGIAGPGGGSAEKPVGTLCLGLATPEGTYTQRRALPFADRERNREMAAALGLRWLLSCIERAGSGAHAEGDPARHREVGA